MEVRIYEGNMKKFEEKVIKLNKKAKKLGLDNITIEIKGIEHTYNKEVKAYLQYNIVEINQTNEIKINGWNFVAKLTRNVGDSFLVCGSDTEKVPYEFKNPTTCQHCNTKRRRNNYYILQHDNGEYKTVGKTCLIDFIGHKNAESIAKFFEEFNSLSDNDFVECGFKDYTYYKVEEVLKCALHSISSRGYVKSDGDFSTKIEVELMIEKHKNYKEEYEIAMKIEDNKIKDMIELVKELDENNDFITNIKSLLNNEYINPKLIGFLVYVPILYKKQTEKKIMKNANTTEYIGNVGDKVELELKYVSCRVYDGHYGATFYHNFQDDNGNIVIWKSSGSKCDTLCEEDINTTINIKGTIKEHSEFNHNKQTYLTRCKILCKQI